MARTTIPVTVVAHPPLLGIGAATSDETRPLYQHQIRALQEARAALEQRVPGIQVPEDTVTVIVRAYLDAMREPFPRLQAIA